MTSADGDDGVLSRLVEELREALVWPLSDGTWPEIKDTHRRTELPWRDDLEPGWGKPKYVRRVLNDLSDAEIIAVARRAVVRLSAQRVLEVEDVLFWIEASGIARVSEVTRMALAGALEGRRLHPSDDPTDVLGRFAERKSESRFAYNPAGELVAVDSVFLLRDATATVVPCLTMLDAFRFRRWPDARLFQFLEFLVHPTVRRDDEQASFVQALNTALAADRFELTPADQVSGHPVFAVRPVTGRVDGRAKNLIFASTGPKPELGFVDAVNNDIEILRGGNHILIYDEWIGREGLRWVDLVTWWAAREGLEASDPSTRKKLAERLQQSLASEPERRFFVAYFKLLKPLLGDALPALVPQVYLHYDPRTLRELSDRGDGRRFDVQRMDFLLLLANGVRIVVEIDGQQHYSTGSGKDAKPSPQEYARTARADRNLRLAGYEVYRFGGYELASDAAAESVIETFFTRLFRRHPI